DFLKRLPEDVQDDFRNEVNAKRKYAMQVERDHLLKDELNNEKLLNNFALKLPENERSAFWKEVETKREERRRKKQKWIKISVGVVGAILLIKWIKVFAGIAIVLFILYAILGDDHQERN
ncbi:hypothetical protein VU04_05200, partial [Desulfobulbus sp. TB]|nr:hypothetical protein [Desulfobulbus sp. TB]